jgi:prepilin-type N-terminal cleavage/methylation domain-containing protein
MKSSKGFTLIELIVVMAVFLFIIGAAIGIFIAIIQNQRKVLAEQEFLNQISYVEEYMSKALRMAAVDDSGNCLVDVTSPDKSPHPGNSFLLTRYNTGSQMYTGIKFINASNNNVCTEFFIDNAVSGNANSPMVLKELKNSVDEHFATALTSSNMRIKSARFLLNGLANPTVEGFVQPRVTVLLEIEILGDSQGQTRTIQTTVSQRNIKGN